MQRDVTSILMMEKAFMIDKNGYKYYKHFLPDKLYKYISKIENEERSKEMSKIIDNRRLKNFKTLKRKL